MCLSLVIFFFLYLYGKKNYRKDTIKISDHIAHVAHLYEWISQNKNSKKKRKWICKLNRTNLKSIPSIYLNGLQTISGILDSACTIKFKNTHSLFCIYTYTFCIDRWTLEHCHPFTAFAHRKVKVYRKNPSQWEKSLRLYKICSTKIGSIQVLFIGLKYRLLYRVDCWFTWQFFFYVTKIHPF